MQETVVKVLGYRGGEMTIAGPDAGAEGVYLATKVEGLMDPEAKAVTKVQANRPGQRFLSSRILERSLTFKVTVFNDGSDAWVSRDTAWRQLWDYSKYSTIEVQVPGGNPRRLQCRLDTIEVDTEYDPRSNEATDVAMTVVADDPFWYEDDFVVEGTSTAAGTLFNVESANPSGVDVFAKWVVKPTNAATAFQISDYDYELTPQEYSTATDGMINLGTLTVGTTYVVNTDPGARQLLSNGPGNAWAGVAGARFRNPIPPYTGAAVFKIIGVGEYQLRIPRRFARPWGNV